MLIRNPFLNLTRFEWALWLISILTVTGAYALSGAMDPLTVITSLIGVTALILVARGDVWGQLLTVLFTVLYAGVSLKFRYYGELVTSLGMTAPIAVLTVRAWLKHPFEGTSEVRVHRLDHRQRLWMVLLTIFVTVVFYFILAAFQTANLMVSTFSIATSFLASYLMLFRSPSYALAFAANDLILIALWVLAALDDLSYLPMIACFFMFLLNDLYGYFSWIRMRERQQKHPACGAVEPH